MKSQIQKNRLHIIKNILLFLIVTTFVGCEEVVDVDLTTSKPRLVIDASINWEKGTLGNSQTISLTTTTGYYASQIPVVSGATVFITNSANTVFDFIETPNTGNYTCSNFAPLLNETYKLTVSVNGQTYNATETMLPAPAISAVEQTNDLGLNNDEIGLKITFQDFANQLNFYLFRFDSTINPFPQYQITDDRFADGNTLFWLYSHEKLEQGKTIKFTQYGVSENYYNYMKLIINATSGSSNGPFQVTPTKARGNIINQTDSKNYALGYFRLCEVVKSDYTIE
jgi:hypothetical protein